ncbi:hypothetical protein [Planctellipticum variicoloris]|uniref:hypothetical protein n=1 Tax=Planctellipticum variicoloris TaxID=3064265 RepID=UPI003013456E|nr:hypothetical protein SH412_000956 [Planctomycetaceae bacterium SH412]
MPTDVRLLIDAVTGTVRDGEPQHVPTFRRLTPRQLVWLRAYGGSGRLGIACRAAGVSWKAHGSWLKHNPDFRDAFELVRLDLVQRLENVALARVFSPEKCSDRLLIFMMKRLDKMADRSAKSGEQER